MSIGTFEDLECWKACRALRVFVARTVVPGLSRDEKYRLGDQLIRAGRSATANVAEGYGRYHDLENAKFCSNARGSCYEVLDHFIAGNDEGIISDEQLNEGRELMSKAVKCLNGYIKYLRKKARTMQVREEHEEYMVSEDE